MSESASQRLAFVQNHLQMAACAAEEPKKKTYVHFYPWLYQSWTVVVWSHFSIISNQRYLCSIRNSPVESMTEEREKATFDIREMTYFLDGGEKNTKVWAPSSKLWSSLGWLERSHADISFVLALYQPDQRKVHDGAGAWPHLPHVRHVRCHKGRDQSSHYGEGRFAFFQFSLHKRTRKKKKRWTRVWWSKSKLVQEEKD